jgi:hypothetical protein
MLVSRGIGPMCHKNLGVFWITSLCLGMVELSYPDTALAWQQTKELGGNVEIAGVI